MRTKALLGLAALAASVATTVAQSNVYSINIVGYVNVTYAAGSTIAVNPLDKDGINSGSNIFAYGAQPLPDGSSVFKWTGSAYDVYYTEAGDWFERDTVTPRTPPILAPGTGFFMKTPISFTNTYTGNVLPGPGTTNTAAISAGSSLIGSRLPVSGSVTQAIFNFPTVDGQSVFKWTGSAYDVYYFESGDWFARDTVTPRPPPSVTVGEGFFFKTPSGTSWTQWLLP